MRRHALISSFVIRHSSFNVTARPSRAVSSLLLAAALAGYALLLASVPIRAALRDGWRAVRRYPVLAWTLGAFGFANAAWALGARAYLSSVLPLEERPTWAWARSAIRAERDWWWGEPGALWHLPGGALREAARDAFLPALDATAGIFNCLAPTFPLAALAAAALFLNWRGTHGELARALRKRFGFARGTAAQCLILVCALAALAKPLLYLPPRGVEPLVWVRWSPVVAWLGFGWEYALGVGMQVGAILLVYCWVRGLSFRPRELLALAVRRFPVVARWAVLVALASTLLIDAPLIARNFPALAALGPADPAALDRWVAAARLALAALALLFATVQITLVFHSEGVRAAVRDHFGWMRRHGALWAWLVVIAGLHFWLLQFARGVAERAAGEGTALWVGVRLTAPWLGGWLGAWALASWVCVWKGSAERKPEWERGRIATPTEPRRAGRKR